MLLPAKHCNQHAALFIFLVVKSQRGHSVLITQFIGTEINRWFSGWYVLHHCCANCKRSCQHDWLAFLNPCSSQNNTSFSFGKMLTVCWLVVCDLCIKLDLHSIPVAPKGSKSVLVVPKLIWAASMQPHIFQHVSKREVSSPEHVISMVVIWTSLAWCRTERKHTWVYIMYLRERKEFGIEVLLSF